MDNNLLANIARLHTTKMGAERIARNLSLPTGDAVAWCRRAIESADDIIRRGKNFYIRAGDVTVTVNASSFTVITAHRRKT